MRRVTAGWTSTLYGTGTLARACLMEVFAGCAQLSWGQERQAYIHAINFHLSSNSAKLAAWTHVHHVHCHPHPLPT
jgi:hypothetical protein